MKTRILLLVFLLLTAVTGFCTTWNITNNGNLFTPSTINIASGDDVNFTFTGVHRVVEVSLANYNAGTATLISNGFSTPDGGGLVPAGKLTVGTHYYVCFYHASMGMKGIITVSSLGLNNNQLVESFTVFPNPTTNSVTIKAFESFSHLPYRITDVEGRQVLSGKLENEITPIDLTPLNAGIYFLQVGEERRQTFKLIKN